MADYSLLKQIDDALGRYYALQKAQYRETEDGMGKFETYVTENGLDDDGTIEEEMNQPDPSESLLVDFDENFPGIDASDPKRNEKIFGILQTCVENEAAFMEEDERYSALQIDANHWRISERDIDKITKLHKAQCPTLFDNKFEGDRSILKLLVIGLKVDRPYLQWLADMYQREKVDCKDKVEQYRPMIWSVSNRHCQELKNYKEVTYSFQTDNMDKSPLDDARMAITSYFSRISPELMVPPTNVIMDSLSQTCEYIAGMIDFVHGLADVNKQTCPFQFDVTIAFNETKASTPAFAPENKDGSSDDSDDDDYESKQPKKIKQYSSKFYDVFGNVKEKLKSENLLHTITQVSDDIESEDSPIGVKVKMARMFNGEFEKFKMEEIPKKYRNNELQQYPRRHRFCCFIDRREPNTDDNKQNKMVENDEVIFYEPPDDCNTFPKEEATNGTKIRPLYYFETLRTCIIPNIGYSKNAKKPLQTGMDQKEQLLSEPITCASHCNGAILVLSFHVESIDEIRCYLYMNGQVLRFFPSDIVSVLPAFFDKTFADNGKFAKSKEARTLVEQMQNKLKDLKFTAFLNKYKCTIDDIIAAKNRYISVL